MLNLAGLPAGDHSLTVEHDDFLDRHYTYSGKVQVLTATDYHTLVAVQAANQAALAPIIHHVNLPLAAKRSQQGGVGAFLPGLQGAGNGLIQCHRLTGGPQGGEGRLTQRGIASGGRYQLAGLVRPTGTGTPCCCAHLPITLRKY